MQKLTKEFEFYEQKASSVEQDLPMARNSDDIAEAKEIFYDFKRATDGMASTGMLIVEKLVSQGTIAEANSIRERINLNRTIVNDFGDIYKDFLSFTET